MLKKECQFLLDVISNSIDKDTQIDTKDIDWIELAGQACTHRLGGMLYLYIQNNKISNIPSGITYSLRRICEAQDQRTLIFRKYIQELSAAICQAGISHAFLKGSILSNTIYELGARSSNDIDILINAEDISLLEGVLSSLGFIQGEINGKSIEQLSRHEIIKRRMNWGETAPYLKLTNEPTIQVISVDINFSLDWLPTATTDAVKKMLNRTKLYSLGDVDAFSLNEEDFLLHLCMHLFKEAVLFSQVIYGKDLGLYKFADIYKLIYCWEIDWDVLVQKTMEYGIEKEVFFVFTQLMELFPTIGDMISLQIMEKLKPNELSYLDEVLSIADKKTYLWKNTILDRQFDKDRMNYLVELS